MMHHSLFGTDGIRTHIGHEPLTLESLPRLGIAIAQWAHETHGHIPTILLGHDTRQSCALIKAALQSGLLAYNAQVFDAQVIPTPGLYAIIQTTQQFDVGIIISASHNPWHDNGIKIVDSQRGKLSAHDEMRITTLFYEHAFTPNYLALGQLHSYTQATAQYTDYLTSFFAPHYLRGTTIALDCAQGATAALAPAIFAWFGANVITINNQPTGFNINEQCGALHLESLQKAVQENNADIGFAFDGDGDRVIAVTKQGDIKNGDDILALLINHPAYAAVQSVIGTVMANQGFESFLHSRTKQLVRTNVGDKFVSERMEQEHSIIGGEQSGHIILRDYLNTGDGIFTALRIIETVLLTNNWTMETFTKFPQVLINLKVGARKDLTLPACADIIKQHSALVPHGRVFVRYSGTEPVLRILVEDSDESVAHAIGKQLSEELLKQLSYHD